VAGVLLAATPAALGGTFSVTNLGTLGGTTSVGYGINDAGQVVGISETGAVVCEERIVRGFRWTAGRMENLLPALDDDPNRPCGIGVPSSWAYGINDRGFAVGYSFSAARDLVPMIWWPDGTKSALRLPGMQPIAYAINDAGAIVGDLGSNDPAFLLTGDATTRIALNPPDGPAAARAINESGMVAGHSTLPGQEGTHAFLHAYGVTRDLGTLGGRNSFAYGINDAGVVVGTSDIAGGRYRAFALRGGGLVDLGTLGGRNSEARDVNNAGAIVGWAGDAGDRQRAFLLSPGGTMRDLNALIAPDGRWTLQVAAGVNDRGEIAGTGLHDGQRRAYVLTPPPVVTGAPAITGTARVGEAVAASAGSWNALLPLSFSFAWQRCDAAGGACTAIAGATAASYTVQAADRGGTLRVAVRAAMPGGGWETALSAPGAVLDAASAASPPAATPPGGTGAAGGAAPSPAVGGTQAPGTSVDATAPRIALAVPARVTLRATARAFSTRVTLNETGRVRVGLSILVAGRQVVRLSVLTRRALTGRPVVLTWTLPAAARGTLRRLASQRARNVVLVLAASATDAAGNPARSVRRVPLRLLGAAAPPAPRRTSAIVASITDGDTLRLRGGVRVRLLQIDAPERGECHGERSTAALRRLLPPGTPVTLAADPALDARDSYGRQLRYIWRGARLITLELVRQGAAAPYFYRGERGRYAGPLMTAARSARAARRGLWRGCPAARLAPTQALATGVVAVAPRPAARPTRPTRPAPAVGGYTWPTSDVDCGDISYDYAQWILGQDRSDPHRLDGDKDGVACES
jgi:probable HAF family extracellular repeat protein